MTIQEMLKEINRIIAKCEASEKDTYEALVAESEGWSMRLDEIEEEENEGDEEEE